MSKFIIFLLAIAILYYLIKGDKKHEKLKKPKQEVPQDSEDMVLDPQCQTYVTKDEAYRVKSGEKVYYFCSPECRERYLAKLKA